MILYHYTCEHVAARIGARGVICPPVLIPGKDGVRMRRALDNDPPALALMYLLAWFTDLDYPYRDALGLSSHFIDCDRTTHRYRVTDAHNVTPWLAHRPTVNPWVRQQLEASYGALPAHWYVATEPVPVVYDPV